MNRDGDDMGCPHTEDMVIGVQTSEKLDLNIDHDCHSPSVTQVNATQFTFLSDDHANGDGILKIGTVFESDEQAYRFYDKYAKLVGFSVRKDWVNRSKIHGLVVSRKFTCSKEGYRRKDRRDINVKKHRKETRTGCLAHMIITRQPDGKYRVTHFEPEHNHDNIDPNNAQALLLEHEFCVAQAAEDYLPNNLATESNSDFELMNRRFELRDSLDFLAIEFDNHLRSERTRDMKEGDAGRLLYYFQRQHLENPSFSYAVQVDVDDKVTNIFWADDEMVVAYDHFGDVVCVDMTYRTNKDLQPFVQFIGVNQHNQAIVFAAAFLFDDTIESLKWLFSTFIEAMSGKKPKVILTDQDAAVVEAVNLVLPETSHCICNWQMYQNTLKHLNHLVKDSESFASDLSSCIYGHSDEESFIHGWEALLDKYGLQQNEWLRWMFREKEKWAAVYDRNSYFVDTKGRHVAEDLHFNLRSYLNCAQDLLHFFKIYEKVVDELRFREIQANNEMSKCLPRLMGNIVLLKHASNIYTPKAFEIFQREYEKCLNIVVNQISENGSLLEYKANTFGQTRDYTVMFNASDDTVVCNCMKFEHVGFLCSHALKVLDNRNIKVVPSQYIIKRWTKDARIGKVGNSIDFSAQENPRLVVASRYKDLSRRMLKISARAAESEEAFQFASRQLDEVMEGVEKILMLKPEKDQCTNSNTSAANGAEDENAEFLLDGRTIENQDENSRVRIRQRDGSVSDRSQLKNVNERSSKKKRYQIVEPPSPNSITCISSPSQAGVSAELPTPNPPLQNVYGFDANHAIQSTYEQQNLAMNHQDNPNLYQQSYTDQHESPNQTPLLQIQSIGRFLSWS